MSDIISELRFYAAKQRWPKGLEPLAILLSGAADLISEANQREKDARAKALEEAVKLVDEIAEKQKKAWDDHIESGANGPATSFYPVFERVASDIRALQSEER